MVTEETGIWVQSAPYTYSDNAKHNIDLRFLDSFMTGMKAPCVHEILVRFTGDVTGAVGDLAGEDEYKLLSRVRIRDSGGNYFDLSGATIRLVEQMETGPAQEDTAALTSTTNDPARVRTWRILFAVPKSHRARDYTVELNRFTDGGQMDITFGDDASIDATVNSGTVTVWFRLVDERKRYAKSRMVWEERSISASEANYTADGALRSLWVSSVLSTDGYTDLAAITELNSIDFRWNDKPVGIFTEEYKLQTPSRASDDEFTASTQNAIPLITPYPGQRVGQMEELSSFHLKLGAVPSDSVIVLCTIQDRSVSLMARWLGYPDSVSFAQEFQKRGMVKARGGRDKSISEWDPTLVRRLPVYLG